MGRWYKQYVEVSHKDGTKEKLLLSCDKLDYAEHVYNAVEKAKRKSRPKHIKKKIEGWRSGKHKTILIRDLKELPDSFLNEWFKLQKFLIFQTNKREYYWVQRSDKIDDVFTVHKNYVKFLPKEYV